RSAHSVLWDEIMGRTAFGWGRRAYAPPGHSRVRLNALQPVRYPGAPPRAAATRRRERHIGDLPLSTTHPRPGDSSMFTGNASEHLTDAVPNREPYVMGQMGTPLVVSPSIAALVPLSSSTSAFNRSGSPSRRSIARAYSLRVVLGVRPSPLV